MIYPDGFQSCGGTATERGGEGKRAKPLPSGGPGRRRAPNRSPVPAASPAPLRRAGFATSSREQRNPRRRAPRERPTNCRCSTHRGAQPCEPPGPRTQAPLARHQPAPAQAATANLARLARLLLWRRDLSAESGHPKAPQTPPPPPARSAPAGGSFPTRSELQIDWLPVNGNSFAECHLNKCISQLGVRGSS